MNNLVVFVALLVSPTLSSALPLRRKTLYNVDKHHHISHSRGLQGNDAHEYVYRSDRTDRNDKVRDLTLVSYNNHGSVLRELFGRELYLAFGESSYPDTGLSLPGYSMPGGYSLPYAYSMPPRGVGLSLPPATVGTAVPAPPSEGVATAVPPIPPTPKSSPAAASEATQVSSSSHSPGELAMMAVLVVAAAVLGAALLVRRYVVASRAHNSRSQTSSAQSVSGSDASSLSVA